MTPSEDPVFSRPAYVPGSGQASPNGFPFFASNASSSPRSTPTPTKQYDSASDAFSLPLSQPQTSSPLVTPANSAKSSHAGSGIISGPGKDLQVTPQGSPLPGTPPMNASMPLGQFALGHPMSDKWAMRQETASPQVAAAK